MFFSTDLRIINDFFFVCLKVTLFVLFKNIFARYNILDQQLSFSTFNICIHYFLACIISVIKLAIDLSIIPWKVFPISLQATLFFSSCLSFPSMLLYSFYHIALLSLIFLYNFIHFFKILLLDSILMALICFRMI